MGLKVLLADDSAAIKKVVQICLQDFGVELKTIGTGKDVMSLAKTFKPDICLIDVMLPHKSGYEVATEMKKDAGLQKTPIIMLWSSFMEFDEAKFKASKAEDKLEKPFEATELRELVKKYIPKTKSNPLADHLELPPLKQPEAPVETHTISQTNISAEPWSMSSFEDISKFAASESPAPTSGPDSEWVRKDLGKFKVNIDADGMEENTVSFQYDESNIKDTSFIMKAEVGGAHGAAPVPAPVIPEVVKVTAPAAVAAAPAQAPTPAPAAAPVINLESPEVKALIEKRVSELVAKDAKDIIEKAIWKIVPDLASQLIKEEILRLTSEK